MIFERLLICALVAGLGAGLTSSVVQRWRVIPIIDAAEAYESAMKTIENPIATDETIKQATVPAQMHEKSATPVEAQKHEHDGHAHGDSAWEPKEGFERTIWTVTANIFTSIAFALILLPLIAWWDLKRDGDAATIYTGLIWGIGGWLCFFLWPALGMRPELPGEVGASLQSRQTWWVFTVACACVGFGLILTIRSKLRWLGLVFLALPFMVGAPKTTTPPFAAYPTEIAMQMEILAHQFLTATALANAAQWLVLGALSGVLVPRRLRSALSQAQYKH